jgi:hypothetical protein
VAEDTFDLIIHDDETGEVLLHKRMTQEEAEQALLAFELVKDRPHMALVRAVLSAGLYSINGRSVFARRVPRVIED